MVRTRIAPSPTGYLHIGTARTALFNYLYAKKHGGAFVLRIEDTDLERSDTVFETDIFESLDWLGIIPDESPARGGPHAPYRQSERIASYTPYLEKLLANGHAYYCPHSEAELEAERTSLLASGKPPLHECTARGGEPLDVARGEGIIRFKTPPSARISFVDLIRGEITFESDLLGDFSLAKNLNTPLYNFAVVIDDHEMDISHVIRGEDHISNTPKQILIQEALGISRPEYAHLPLILGPDRAKLSKRHGATAIREFREQGYLPEALVNFVTLLGWNPGSDRELFTMTELTEHFDLAKVQKSGAVFDIEKLNWMNGEYIRKKSARELAELCFPYLADFLQFSIPNDQFSIEYIEKIIALEQPRLKKLAEIGERADFFFRPPEYSAELLRWKQMSDPEIRAWLERSRELLAEIPERNVTREALEATFLKAIGAEDKGAALWPLRAALSGKRASPGPFEIMAVLGKQESRQRVERAIEKLNKN